MKTTDEIINLYKQRLKQYGPLHQKMKTVQSIYNGTMAVPLPDLEQSELPSVPNLLAAGVDQMSGRVTSVVPSITFASARPGIRESDRNALSSARVVQGWWQSDRMPLKMNMRGRHLIAYGMSPCIMRWDRKEHRPVWNTRHPLETFPSTDVMPGQVTPIDCIFAFKRSAAWMRANGYSEQLFRLTERYDTPQDAIVTLLEYVDKECTHLIAAGYRSMESDYSISEMESSGNSMRGVTLEYVPSVTEEIPVTIPMRITLDGATGQFDNMIGMYYQQAKLMALEVIAVEKGIFPDTYLVSRPGEIARFLDGPHDGRTGMVNIIAGGDIRDIQSQPGYLTNPTIDRLERNQRVTAGIPAEFGGESGSNIRTGRRGDAVLSAVIDYPVAEAQHTFAYSLEEENEIAIAMAKAYDGDNKRTLFVGTGNSARPVTYVANKTFETDEHIVSYPASGSDLNSLIVGIGQRIGLGIMSKQTAATLDPYIDNPEQEHDQIISEGLEQALVASIQQQASSGQIPPLVLSKIMYLVKNDKMEIADALNKVTEDAMKEQQKQPAEPGTEMSVDQAMAGPAMQAMTGEPGQASIQGPNQSQQNLMGLLSTLRRPQSAMGGV
jgi:hypothetical protein